MVFTKFVWKPGNSQLKPGYDWWASTWSHTKCLFALRRSCLRAPHKCPTTARLQSARQKASSAGIWTLGIILHLESAKPIRPDSAKLGCFKRIFGKTTLESAFKRIFLVLFELIFTSSSLSFCSINKTRKNSDYKNSIIMQELDGKSKKSFNNWFRKV